MEHKKIFFPESREKHSIDLSALTFNFCADDEVVLYYNQELDEIGNRERWIEENKEILTQNKTRIVQAVKDGMIFDDRPETIWQYEYARTKEGQEKILRIKKELAGKVEDIKKRVAEKLENFLPDWVSKKIAVIFTLNKEADFCVDEENVTVDLGRLALEENFLEKTIQGITHEVFHIWMSEKLTWSDAEQDSISDEILRERIIFKTIDEGLAVLVGGQSLKAYHEEQGKKYDEYIAECFAAFNSFLLTKSREELEKTKDMEFKDMGHFYVAGHEIVQAILQREGIENFKKIIEEARSNPYKILELYKKISADNRELFQIAPASR